MTICPHCQKPLPPKVIGRPPKKSDKHGRWLCTCCDEYKYAEYFGVDNNAINGLTSWCARCRRGE